MCRSDRVDQSERSPQQSERSPQHQIQQKDAEAEADTVDTDAKAAEGAEAQGFSGGRKRSRRRLFMANGRKGLIATASAYSVENGY